MDYLSIQEGVSRTHFVLVFKASIDAAGKDSPERDECGGCATVSTMAAVEIRDALDTVTPLAMTEPQTNASLKPL